MADAAEAARVIVPSGTLATVQVIDRRKPTVTITPTVTDSDLSVAVTVTDRILDAPEVITLVLSAGPTMKSDQMVTLNARTTTDTARFDDLKPGSYTLMATAAPGRINPIVYAGGTQTVTILPLVTITGTLEPSDTVNLVVTDDWRQYCVHANIRYSEGYPWDSLSLATAYIQRVVARHLPAGGECGLRKYQYCVYPYGDSRAGQHQAYRLCRQWADSDNPATGNHNWCVRPR